MRVFNLTDVSTAVLQQRGLVDQQIAAGGRVCCPGQYVDLEASDKVKADLAYLLSVGAVAIDTVPPEYAKELQRRQAAAAATGTGAASRVNLQETPVADAAPATLEPKSKRR